MAKTAVLVGIISMIMMQSVRLGGASKINYNHDHVENVPKGGTERGFLTSKLKIKGSANNLADLDGWTAGNSDPYMEVAVTDIYGYTERKTTPHRGGTNNPTWPDLIFRSARSWEKITVKIMDYDGAGRKPDPLCPTKEISLKSGRGGSVTYNCNPGTATIEYSACPSC